LADEIVAGTIPPFAMASTTSTCMTRGSSVSALAAVTWRSAGSTVSGPSRKADAWARSIWSGVVISPLVVHDPGAG